MLLLVISFMKVPQNLSNKAGQSEMKGFFMNSQEVVLQKGYWYSSMDASLKNQSIRTVCFANRSLRKVLKV